MKNGEEIDHAPLRWYLRKIISQTHNIQYYCSSSRTVIPVVMSHKICVRRNKKCFSPITMGTQITLDCLDKNILHKWKNGNKFKRLSWMFASYSDPSYLSFSRISSSPSHPYRHFLLNLLPNILFQGLSLT